MISPTRAYGALGDRVAVRYADQAICGAPDRAIAHQTRHRSLATLGQYVRDSQVVERGRQVGQVGGGVSRGRAPVRDGRLPASDRHQCGQGSSSTTVWLSEVTLAAMHAGLMSCDTSRGAGGMWPGDPRGSWLRA